MVDFIQWIFNSFYDLVYNLVNNTIKWIYDIGNGEFMVEFGLETIDINLVLFSDTPILTMNLHDLLVLFFSVFYTIIFILIVWKIIKKVFAKITGWNRW